MPETFIDQMPTVTIDEHGIRCVARSGNKVFKRRLPRSLWRAFLETSIRQLDEYEVAERCNVVPLRGHG
jgi:hypothetical protein